MTELEDAERKAFAHLKKCGRRQEACANKMMDALTASTEAANLYTQTKARWADAYENRERSLETWKQVSNRLIETEESK